jgi:transcriptional regulator with XRE-family HTH domain
MARQNLVRLKIEVLRTYVRDAYTHKNLPIGQFCKDVGLSPNMYHRLMRGSEPMPETRVKLQALLGCEWGDLFTDVEESQP